MKLKQFIIMVSVLIFLTTITIAITFHWQDKELFTQSSGYGWLVTDRVNYIDALLLLEIGIILISAALFTDKSIIFKWITKSSNPEKRKTKKVVIIMGTMCVIISIMTVMQTIFKY